MCAQKSTRRILLRDTRGDGPSQPRAARQQVLLGGGGRGKPCAHPRVLPRLASLVGSIDPLLPLLTTHPSGFTRGMNQLCRFGSARAGVGDLTAAGERCREQFSLTCVKRGDLLAGSYAVGEWVRKSVERDCPRFLQGLKSRPRSSRDRRLRDALARPGHGQDQLKLKLMLMRSSGTRLAATS